MKPLHIIANQNEIANKVLLPGDPLRAKYIADNFLEDAKCINTVRNMLGYTGKYKGKKITVIGSGMGIPSVAIYAAELFLFYNVDKIIRIGTAGAFNKNIKIRDIVLAKSAYSDSNYRYELTKNKSKKITSSNNLNQLIINTAKKNNINIKTGVVYTSEVFDLYSPIDHLLKKIPKNINPLACEMEAFGLFTIAKYYNKEATCLLSITDSKYELNNSLTIKERENSLNEMIKLALDSIIKKDKE